MPGTFNLVTDFSSDLTLWNEYAKTATGLVTLNVPAGLYVASDAQKSALCQSGETVIIQGAGSGSTELRVGGVSGAQAAPTGSDTVNNPNPQPRIYSVDAGASSVRLVDASDYSKFIPGHYALLNGLETQYTGYPQNFQFFEYIKVATASATGVITFETQIQNSYRAYWPDSPSFNQFAADLGGAAGLWPILNTADTNHPTMQRADGIQTWGLDLTVRDCTIRGHGGGSNVWFGGCRKLTFENCSFPGYPVPVGGCKEWVARDCAMSSVIAIEIDKLVESIEFDTCTFSGSCTGMSAQSGSIHSLYIHDCPGTLSVNGTTGNTTIENCTLNALQIGTSFYGMCNSVTIDNCSAVSTEGTLEGASNSILTAENPVLSNGVISWTRAEFEDANLYQPARCVPGSAHFLSHSSFRPFMFGTMRLADMREGGGRVYARTTLPEPSDKWDDVNFGGCRRHPCTDITVTNVPAGTVSSGGGQLRVLGRYPAPNMPFGSYYHSGEWNGVGLNSTGSGDKSTMFGKFVSMTVEIITPYTGAQSIHLNPFGGLFGVSFLLDDFTVHNFNPHIDVETVGVRVFTPGSTTGIAGADSNMTAVPANVDWVAGVYGEEMAPMLSTGGGPADISAEASGLWPLMTIELVLDQELDAVTALDEIANYTPVTGGGQTHVITKNIYKGY